MNEIFANFDAGTAGIAGFVMALLTWLSVYLNDKHKRSNDDREQIENSHKSLIAEYTALNERGQKREETLLLRIAQLEGKISELQDEFVALNKLLAECLHNGSINRG